MHTFFRTGFTFLLLGVTTYIAKGAIIVNTDQSGSGALGTISLPGGVTGMMISGTADSGATLVFTGNESLTSPSNGQARIEGADGAFTFLDIRFSLGQLFDRIVFNLDAAASGNVTVQAYNQANVLTATQVIALGVNGQNFINVLASGTDHISSVQFTSVPDLDSIAQVRVDALTPGAVPEPSTFGFVGFALIGLSLAGRKVAKR